MPSVVEFLNFQENLTCDIHNNNAEAYVPVPQISAYATYVYNETILTIPVPSINATGLSGEVGSSSVFLSLPVPIISAGLVFWGSADLTMPQFSCSVYEPFHLYASLTMPNFLTSAYGRSIPFSKIFKGVVVNLSNQGISTYTNYPFNSITYFDGKYIGASDTGIYVLEGDQDNGQNILAVIKTTLTNLSEKVVNFLREIWLNYRATGHLNLNFYSYDRTQQYSSRQTSIVNKDIVEERIKPGRGLRGKFYIIEITNASGSDFSIESISGFTDQTRDLR